MAGITNAAPRPITSRAPISMPVPEANAAAVLPSARRPGRRGARAAGWTGSPSGAWLWTMLAARYSVQASVIHGSELGPGVQHPGEGGQRGAQDGTVDHHHEQAQGEGRAGSACGAGGRGAGHGGGPRLRPGRKRTGGERVAAPRRLSLQGRWDGRPAGGMVRGGARLPGRGSAHLESRNAVGGLATTVVGRRRLQAKEITDERTDVKEDRGSALSHGQAPGGAGAADRPVPMAGAATAGDKAGKSGTSVAEGARRTSPDRRRLALALIEADWVRRGGSRRARLGVRRGLPPARLTPELRRP